MFKLVFFMSNQDITHTHCETLENDILEVMEVEK